MDVTLPKTHCPECKVEVRSDRLAKHLAKHDRYHASLQRQMTKWQAERENSRVDTLLTPRGDSKDHPDAPTRTKALDNVSQILPMATRTKQGGEEVRQSAFNSTREMTRCPQCGVQVRESRLGHHLVQHIRGKMSRKKEFKSESVWTVSGGLPESNRRRH
jgi:endogenous inhibitor of DNA gyrase (YacG/DUF329 family)